MYCVICAYTVCMGASARQGSSPHKATICFHAEAPPASQLPWLVLRHLVRASHVEAKAMAHRPFESLELGSTTSYTASADAPLETCKHPESCRAIGKLQPASPHRWFNHTVSSMCTRSTHRHALSRRRLKHVYRPYRWITPSWKR